MTMWTPNLDESGPVYLAITRALEADIRGGQLREGDRLPPHRDLATALGVNVGTVSRAYAEARRRRLIRGEVGRGTFVCHPVSPTLTPRRRSAAADVLDLSVNLPLLEPAPDLAAALHALADRPDLAQATGYGDPAGAPRVREAGVRWLADLGVAVTPEQVVVCAGAQHGILVALASVVGPGELVLAESLTYPGFVAAARMLGLRVRGVEMDEQGLLPDALEAACAADRPRLLYCMPTVQNPTTALMPADRRAQIAAIAEAHDLIIVQDDVQGSLIEDPAPSLAALAPERVITIAGVSKNLAPSLRVAFVAGPRASAARMSELVWGSVWMASPLGAEIAASWIEDGSAADTVTARRREMEARHQLATDALGSLRYRTVPAAYHLWLELPEPWDGRRFAAALLERGVAVSAAEAFLAAPGAAPAAVRISLSGAADRPALRRGLELVAELAGELPEAVPVRL